MRRVSAPNDRVVVVGAGASTLISSLVDDGYDRITAVDISAAALDQLRARLGDEANRVETIVSDVCDLTVDPPADVWHDRAVFHFLTEESDQLRYVDRAARAVRTGGALILATFSPEGPEQCSGLPVARWDATELAARFAPWFEVRDRLTRVHTTPWGSAQSFTHVLMIRSGADGRG